MATKHIEQLIKSFKKVNVLIIGDVMVDRYVKGIVNRISPEAPVPIVDVKNIENRLGGAANVAINIKNLGATPHLFGVVGNDEAGKLFSKQLKEEKISVTNIVTDKTRPTTVKTRVLSGNSQLIRLDEESTTAINKTVYEQLLKAILQKIKTTKIDVIIFEDYDKGVLSLQLIETITKVALTKQIPVVVDPKKRNFLHYTHSTLFKPNLKEIKEGLNIAIDVNDKTSLQNAIKLLAKKIKCTEVMVTLSDKGVISYDGKIFYHVPAHVRTITDVSGAGDTVIAVTALCKAISTDLKTTTQLANLAGGIVCEYPGVVSITAEKLLVEAEKIGI